MVVMNEGDGMRLEILGVRCPSMMNVTTQKKGRRKTRLDEENTTRIRKKIENASSLALHVHPSVYTNVYVLDMFM